MPLNSPGGSTLHWSAPQDLLCLALLVYLFCVTQLVCMLLMRVVTVYCITFENKDHVDTAT